MICFSKVCALLINRLVKRPLHVHVVHHVDSPRFTSALRNANKYRERKSLLSNGKNANTEGGIQKYAQRKHNNAKERKYNQTTKRETQTAKTDIQRLNASRVKVNTNTNRRNTPNHDKINVL